MHPMAILGIITTVVGILAVGAVVVQSYRLFGGQSLLQGAGAIPYLIFAVGAILWLSLVFLRGRRAWPYLAVTLGLTAVTYLLFNR